MKHKLQRRGDTVVVKDKDLQRFLDEGWTQVDASQETVSTIGTASATADVKEDSYSEDDWSEEDYAEEPQSDEGDD